MSRCPQSSQRESNDIRGVQGHHPGTRGASSINEPPRAAAPRSAPRDSSGRASLDWSPQPQSHPPALASHSGRRGGGAADDAPLTLVTLHLRTASCRRASRTTLLRPRALPQIAARLGDCVSRSRARGIAPRPRVARPERASLRHRASSLAPLLLPHPPQPPPTTRPSMHLRCSSSRPRSAAGAAGARCVRGARLRARFAHLWGSTSVVVSICMLGGSASRASALRSRSTSPSCACSCAVIVLSSEASLSTTVRSSAMAASS